ncbi:hypothetical protein [Uliginosibacterium sediminicola]|uniref:Uncharacterized protein n=1 Tax=Uliginosibacterium sediminicola TaxID=2024550 RepID=A0ABU9Z038_9RHOO
MNEQKIFHRKGAKKMQRAAKENVLNLPLKSFAALCGPSRLCGEGV